MKNIFGIVVVVLLVALAAGAYFYFRPSVVSVGGVQSSTAPAATLKPHRTPPAGYKEYYNAAYRFSFFYPDTLSVTEQPGEQDTDTILFQDASTTQAIEIYVLPYGQPQVTTERFKKDDPSGIRDNLQIVTIDGATGASFFSNDSRLGDTAEVWVTHGGFLYEVATLKPLAQWFSGIMQNWEFL